MSYLYGVARLIRYLSLIHLKGYSLLEVVGRTSGT